jgi:hypothetical protein
MTCQCKTPMLIGGTCVACATQGLRGNLDENVHIENASLDELLRDLTGPSPRPSSPVAKWLETCQIYPGTTRVQAKDLYAEFAAWYSTASGITDKIPNISHWGREMTRRFKTASIRKRTYYYISRQVTPTIPKKL